MTALDSFDSLIDFAAGGREYRYDEVWIPNPHADDTVQTDQIVGNGFDFTRPMSVPDNAEEGTVEGTVHLRVLRLTNGEELRLLLRTRLEWTTSAGVDHVNSAYYDLSRNDVENLSLMDPPSVSDIETASKEIDEKFGDPENISMDQASDLLGMLFEQILSAPNSHCKASWNHSWSNEISEEEAESLLSKDLDTRTARIAESDAEGDYHVRVIYDLFRREEPLVCMLSDTEFGAVYAAELITLSDWVENNATV